MSQKKFLTTADITNLFGIDEETIQSLVDAGELKALADRGTWKYRHDDVVALIEQGRLQANKELPTVDDVDFDESIGLAGSSTADERVDFLELDEEALSEGSTVISSGTPEVLENLQLSFTDSPAPSSSDVRVFEPAQAIGSDSDIKLHDPTADAEVQAGALSDSAPSSSDVQAVAQEEAGAELADQPPAVEGIDLDFEEPQDEEVATVAFVDEFAPAVSESDVSAIDEGDSGLTLETSDSGLTLEASDSGLTLDAGDSGLTLDSSDSGLTLDAGDSGLSLGAGDSEVDKATEELDFVDDHEDSEHTAVLMVDDDGSGEFIGSLSDAGESVEDLEVSEDLSDAIADEDEFVSAEEEILDAEDGAFSDEFVGESEEDEDYLAPAAKAVPREPTWGALTSIMVFGAAGLVGTNIWLMWEGLSTMWSGSDPSGPAAGIISSIASMLG